MKFDIYRKQVRYWSYFEHFNNSTYFTIIRYLKLLHDNMKMIVYMDFQAGTPINASNGIVLMESNIWSISSSLLTRVNFRDEQIDIL